MYLAPLRTIARRLPILLVGLAMLNTATPSRANESRGFPSIVIITVDTLRADRLSAYGYARPTSPNIDRLLAGGARFLTALTPEPLTSPALCSMVTGLEPQAHGSTRNGLHMQPGLPSLPKLLASGGYRTAAIVGTWTLRDKLSGLGEHFETYQEILNRKRWFGLLRGESTAEDLTTAAIAWLDTHQRAEGRRPFLLWVHYVEPHAPYRLQERFAARLGVPKDETASRSDRYDTEIAFVDEQIGALLRALETKLEGSPPLVVFASDHGESLGEHGYWGHGRNVHEPNLRIPLGFAWSGRIPAGTVIDSPAMLHDIGATVLGLLGLHTADGGVQGFDWSGVLLHGKPPPTTRTLRFQAHRGAFLGAGDAKNARVNGLLEVGVLRDDRKEILRLQPRERQIFYLTSDPRELRSTVAEGSAPSTELAGWLAEVEERLRALTRLDATRLDAESIEQLKALGYID